MTAAKWVMLSWLGDAVDHMGSTFIEVLESSRRIRHSEDPRG